MMMSTIARHHESPIEVERRRRQLGPAPVIRSTLEQLQPRQRRHTAPAGGEEVRQLQQRRATAAAGEEEQLVQRRQQLGDTAEGEETAGWEEQLQQRREQLEETAGGEEQLRDRRQTSDPDQLCPTLASFVMPRAAVNSAGDWMFIVNMQDQVQFQQLVRAEVCM